MLGAPAPFRAQMTYIQSGQPVFSLTCRLGAPRDVQQWVNGQMNRERIELAGPSASVRLSSVDNSRNPNTTFRMFREDDPVRLVSAGVDLPAFSWSEFDIAYLAFHKSCHRGFSPGGVPAYPCGVPPNLEARTLCRTPDLARLQRETVERYEHFTRRLVTVDQGVAAWGAYASHMEAVASCGHDPTGDCLAPEYRQFLAELVRLGDLGLPAIPRLSDALPDDQVQAELMRHGFSAARGLGSMEELHFIEARLGDRNHFVVLHDVPMDQAISPVDERLLFAAAQLADALTLHHSVTLNHIVRGHPVPANAAGEAGVPDVAHTRLTLSWSNNDVDTLLVRFGEDRSAEPVSAQDLLGEVAERNAATQDYRDRVTAGLARMQEEIRASDRASEVEMAQTAADAGLVYRNPEFWANFGYRDTARVFEGRQVSPILALRYLAGWLAAYGSICPEANEPMRDINWPDGPAIRRILADAPEAGLFPEDGVVAVRDSYADLLEVAVQPAILGENVVSRSLQDPLIARRITGAEQDAARLLQLAGCNSATASQFELNLIRILQGAPSLQEAGPGIDGAARESDAAPN